MDKTFKIMIDGRETSVTSSTTLLQAARQLGIAIPTLCYLKAEKSGDPEITPSSCQVCLVKANGRIVPSCATKAVPDMVVECETNELRQLRQTAFELLLSEHVGDCYAPCQWGCPAKLDIPKMLRFISRGEFENAMLTIWERIPIPSILGRICPRPCEKVCRRGKVDEPVTICQLKRYVADTSLGGTRRLFPPIAPPSGRRIAVIGAGPAGLSAAWFLTLAGHAVVLYEKEEMPGGRLRNLHDDVLPVDVLDFELENLFQLGEPNGIEFRHSEKIDVQDPARLNDLLRHFDAILLAIGEQEAENLARDTSHLKCGPRGILVDGQTYVTNRPGIFAIGTAIRKSAMVVRSVADGREAAEAIGEWLVQPSRLSASRKDFSVRIKSVQPNELEEFEKNSLQETRWEPSDAGTDDYQQDMAQKQADRCYHCDCRGRDKCRLLKESRKIMPELTRFPVSQRQPIQIRREGNIIYEPGKCIKCGLCIRLAREYGEPLGLTFVGRGFDVRVAVPFGESLQEALSKTAAMCVSSCPTGALVFD